MNSNTPEIRFVKGAAVRAMLGGIRAATLRQLSRLHELDQRISIVIPSSH